MAGINGTGIALLSAGGALAYAGLKGVSIQDSVRQVLTGKPAAQSSAIVGLNSSTVAGTIGGVNTNDPVLGGSSNGIKVAQLAASQLGKPYVFDTPINPADANPPTFDCSGLTMWCYYRIGILLTHYTGTQYAQLSHRPFAQASPGDLVFYQNRMEIYHVAIYVGYGQVIEAPEPGVPVHQRAVSAGDADLMANVGVCP